MSKGIGIQRIRGFNDILPESTPLWRQVERTAAAVLESYGFEEIRLPLLEKTELFSRSIGEVTDIVEKEMYSFTDRNGDSLTLRPEGTAGCVRACLQNGMLHGLQPRVWYTGAMFRHERPQKGRYRQFHQIGAELFGQPGPDVDAEMILMTGRLLKALGLSDVKLLINSIGTLEERAGYREALVAYFQQHADVLDEDSQRRLTSNPLRILDSKNPDMQSMLNDAPSLLEYLGEASQAHFDTIKAVLDRVGMPYQVTPRLVRGLDYYNRTVFEWVTDRLGAQGTVLAGGRFDGLVEQLGGKPTPAIGFGMGMERVIELLAMSGAEPGTAAPDVYWVVQGEAAQRQSLVWAEMLRDRLPGIRVAVHAGGGSFKSQFKKADKSGAAYALVLGEAELAEECLNVKPLRDDGEQQRLDMEGLTAFLENNINRANRG